MKYSSTANSTVEVSGQPHTLPALLPGKNDGCTTELGSGCFGKEKNTTSCQSAVKLIA